jgi:hypothetical protein
LGILSPNFLKPSQFKHPEAAPNGGQHDVARPEKTVRTDGVGREEAERTQVSAAKCELVAEVARNFGEVRMGVLGLSMFPCLLPGDIVTVERRAIEDFRAGDIAKYLRDGRLMVHRVIELREGKLITRGDAAIENDAPVRAEEIVGKVVSVARGGKRFEPTTAPSRRERGLAKLARHSSLAARLLLFLKFPTMMTNQRRATPTERAALCQN